MGKKLTIEEMKKIAKKREGECLSKEYINAHTKLKWRCNIGHEWEAAPDNIKNKNAWCPYCTGGGIKKYEGKPIKEIYEKYIKISSEKVIEEWAKYKSLQWYNDGIISKKLKEFFEDRYSVKPEKYPWKSGFYEHYQKFNPIINSYKRKYLYGIPDHRRRKTDYKIRKIPLIECKRCGGKSKLERHHIIPYNSGGDASPNNIIVLCNTCHIQITNISHFIKKERNRKIISESGLQTLQRKINRISKNIIGKKIERKKIQLDPNISTKKNKTINRLIYKMLSNLRKEIENYLRSINI